MRFYDRETELERLAATDRVAFSRASRFTVMTGRRRVGKTELVRKHMERLQGRGIYLFVARSQPAILLEEYRTVAAGLFPELGSARFASVPDLLESLLRLSARKPVMIVLDEFQNFLHADPAAYSGIQRVWDLLNREARCHLLVAGSTSTLMSRIFGDAREPLYGRATDRLPVAPFGPHVVSQILAEHDRGTDLLPFMAVFGGIPRYYDLIDRYGLWRAPLRRLLSTLVLDKAGVLYAEGRELLMEEFGRDHQIYFSVLSAIAAGHTRMSRIADACGIPINSIGKYLDQLQKRYDLIERLVPALEPGPRHGSYRLKDPFLRFWFRYVHRNASFLEVGSLDRVADLVESDLPTFLGPSFEALCRDVLVERSRAGETPFGLGLTYVGRWWDRGAHEIDLVAGNDKHVLLVECKLSARGLDRTGHGRFLASCDAFAARHPRLSQHRLCITWDATRSARSARRNPPAAGRVEILPFAELWTR